MRRWRVAAGVGTATLSVVIVVVAVRISETPAWAIRAAVDCASGRDGEAESRSHRAGRLLESNIVSEIHRIRPTDGPWQLSIPLGEAQAWLDCRLPEWLAHGDADLELDLPNGLRLGSAGSDSGSGDGLVIGAPQGGVFATLVVGFSRTPAGWEAIPRSALVGSQAVPVRVLGWMGWMPEVVSLPSLIELGDGRVVEVDSISVQATSLVLDLRTRAAPG
ncbi:MAG: hypothetical protein O2819_06010 [Planctomycetota bacterium]|nr:hypothetical protein [Planctomycetota bacterium]MDA1106403.1 hypothetical protein [Planctomycetota bacterium]